MLTIEEKVSSLYRELSRCSKENNDEKCLEISKAIFKITRSKTAFQYQIIASIRMGLCQAAIHLLEQNEEPWSPLENELLYEKAYCYYRIHAYEKAHIALDKLKKGYHNHLATLHLEAQILYAEERYEKALEIYQQIKSMIKEEEDEEIEANIIAIKACITWNTNQHTTLEENHSSYECLYNTACLYLGMNQLEKAKKLLEFSRFQCSNKLNDADLSVEEKDKELIVIATQLAYTLQMLDKNEEAKELYDSIISIGSHDDLNIAISSNNLVALNQHVSNSIDLFHSAKLLKLTHTTSLTNLKLFQKRTLYLNQALLQFHMKKWPACRKIIDQMPETTGLCMILTATLEKNEEKRIELLRQFASEHTNNIPIHLAFIQSLVQSGKDEEALSVLLSLLRRLNMDKQHRIPIALTALLVWLFQRIGKTERAYDLLDEIEDNLHDIKLKKQVAAFNLKIGRFDRATQQYEYLVRLDTNDMQSIAGLITVYHNTNPAKADKYMNSLPRINIQHIQVVDELEYQIIKQQHQKQPFLKKEKKKKKRKPLLPKTNNKGPDPERWLPKSEKKCIT